MENKKRKVWRGDLAKPIKMAKLPARPTLITGAGTPEVEAEYEHKAERVINNNSFHCATEALKKLVELLKYYGIDQNCEDRWFLLALRLATDHVPGFRVETEKQSGRPQKWNPLSLAFLYFDVEDLEIEKKEKNLPSTHTDLFRTLAKRAPYKGKGLSAKTLGNQYNRAKNSPFVRKFNLIKEEPRLQNSAQELKEILNSLREK